MDKIKPRKGLQTDAVVHKGYEWTEVKFIEQKRPVNQKDYAFTNRSEKPDEERERRD